MFLKVGYVGDNIVKDNKIEVPFIKLKKDVPIELETYVNNYVFE